MDQKEIDSNLVHILTIYMRPFDRMGTGWLTKMFSRPKYLELMLRAKEYGIKRMIARHSLASFSKEKHIQTFGTDIPNPNKLLCIEMMGDHDFLKAFCKQKAELLQEAIVIFREVEEWEIPAFNSAMTSKTDLVGEILKLKRPHGGN